MDVMTGPGQLIPGDNEIKACCQEDAGAESSSSGSKRCWSFVQAIPHQRSMVCPQRYTVKKGD